MMKKVNLRDFIAPMICLIIVQSLLLSCSEPNVYNTTYEDQMKLFLSDSEDGRELFTSDIYSSAAFERSGSSDKYYYVIDSIFSDTTIRIDTIPRDVPPYSDVLTATAEIEHAYFGEIMHIGEAGDSTHAYDYLSIISRTAFFVKIYNDGYQYHGWRFWGYLSKSGDGSMGRTISDGHYITSVSEQGLSYLLYDTLDVYDKGDSLTYSSNTDDIIFVRTGENTIRGLKTQYSSGKHETGWKIGNTTNPFNRLVFVETPVDYRVDTVSISPLVIDTLKVTSYGYVAFYKAQ